MNDSHSPEISVAIRLPSAVAEQINQWADQSGLPCDKFNTTAFILGGRAMSASLDLLPPSEIPPEVKQPLAESANSVNPALLLQIVNGDRNQSALDDQTLPEIDLIVDLPSDELARFDRAGAAIGMTPSKFYALAFVTGAKTMAGTLQSDSVFSPEISAHITDESISPVTLAKYVRPQALFKSFFKKGKR